MLRYVPPGSPAGGYFYLHKKLNQQMATRE